MKACAILVIVFALFFAACERRGEPAAVAGAGQSEPVQNAVSKDRLLQLQVAAFPASGRKLIDVLHELNEQVSEAVNGDPRGEIVIVRNHPRIDNGDCLIEVDLPASTLGERLKDLGQMTLTHWTISENGYLVYRTWHRPEYDFDDEDGLLNQKIEGEQGSPSFCDKSIK